MGFQLSCKFNVFGLSHKVSSLNRDDNDDITPRFVASESKDEVEMNNIIIMDDLIKTKGISNTFENFYM